MLLHVSHAALLCLHTILICTVDSDVVVRAVSGVHSLKEGTQLWLGCNLLISLNTH